MGRKDIKQKINQTQTAMQTFTNPTFGSIRTVESDGKILFCGSDVAKALGYARPNEAVAKHCKGTLKRSTLTAGGAQEMLFIPEGDVYRLIVRSKLPSAERFEKWVFDEVLPSIRKTGAYSVGQELTDEEKMAHGLIAANAILQRQLKHINQLEEKIREDEPKVTLATAITHSKDCIRIRELAKILKQNGVDTGQNKLFADLRRNGYLISEKGPDYNTPTQKSMDLGLFEIIESTYVAKSGEVHINRTAMVTPKGQTYFIKKITKFFGIDLAQPRICVAKKAG